MYDSLVFMAQITAIGLLGILLLSFVVAAIIIFRCGISALWRKF